VGCDLQVAELQRRLGSGSNDSGTPSSKESVEAKARRKAERETEREAREKLDGGVVAAAMDAAYIGKLERGEYRWPNHRYREALRAVLHAASDPDLGFAAPPVVHRLVHRQ
jgi:hypothetical protein